LKTLLALAFWTCVGVLSATQLYFVWRVGTWGDAMRMGMPHWYVWGMLAPFIFAADRRWIDRLPGWRRIAAHVPLGIAAGMLALLLSYWIQRAIDVRDLPESVGTFFLQQSFSNATTYALIAGVSAALGYADQARKREHEAMDLELHSAQLETSLAEARLRLLHGQLNPHFLFNTFNTISALTETDPRTARQVMGRLGTLLRASLDHAGRQEVTLREELVFLEDYLSIERLRFEDRLAVDVHVENGTSDARVPTFILQPLVENAIRHGTAARVRGGHVRVSARTVGTRLILEVEDNGLGLPPGWRLEDHAGIGLSNIARRLEELYGAEQAFTVRDRTRGGVRVEVSLPLRK
jgi:two-component system, LytTR family, sensor kinase